ncbi:hypothetical protein ABW21_db0202300 [Orbilia brochopaga]|nr:hypothetical protein ABW21_db0202300 [Drechslerella brochopaga]
MVKRGETGCANYNTIYNRGQHHWQHTCTGSGDSGSHEPVANISQFLTETSERFVGFFETDIFTIHVGEEEKTYYVHKDALSSASAVLKKQVNSEMKEGQTKTIILKDVTDRPVAFSLFVQFCYFGGYGYDDQNKEDALVVHASVYVLAEKLGALDLKTVALRKATALCANAGGSNSDESTDKKGASKVLQFCLPEAVPVIYDGTYDANSGKMPSALMEGSKRKQPVIMPVTSRDGFRILLAKFAAAYIDQVRRNESFINVLQEYPTFSSDILLFTSAGSQILTDDKGNLKL